jgi:opacity protein-like surface antigen
MTRSIEYGLSGLNMFRLRRGEIMYKQFRNVLTVGVASLAIIGSSAIARAGGFYADVHGGATIPWNETARVSSDIAPASVNAHTNYDLGWLAGASAGYQWDQGWARGFASEFEFTFRQNHINRIATSAPITLGGDLHSYAMMLNGYYRFLNSTPFTPYIGGGIGEASIALNNTRFAGLPNLGPFSGTDAVLAYQGIGGVSFPICPHVSMAAEYRYFGTLRPGFQQTVAGQELKISPDYYTNNVVLRAVYSF